MVIKTCFLKIWNYYRELSHWGAGKTQMSLLICTISQDPSLHMGQNMRFRYRICTDSPGPPLLAYTSMDIMYCKFGNFRKNFIFANSVKDVFATLKIRDKGMIHLNQ